jgi:3-methyladenine DNA glycosylase AlkC
VPTADELLSADEALALAQDMARVAPALDWSAVSDAAGSFPRLGLRDRVSLLRGALLQGLPQSYAAAEPLIRSALRDPNFRGWRIWPVSEAVAMLAAESVNDADMRGGLSLLAELTPRLTCEFALRIALNAHLDVTLDAALSWTSSPDAHVRRLASEGTRPMLPWAAQVPALRRHPAATLPILEALWRDGSETVRRSVANHLNDISRLDSDLALTTAEHWLADPDEHTFRLVRHALRTLIKQGHVRALSAMGFGLSDMLRVDGPELGSTQVAVGASLSFEAAVINDSDAPVKVAIDYLIHFRKADGSQAARVFKLTTRTLDPRATLVLKRSHSMRPITTMQYYLGAHALELQVNGRRHGQVPFELTAGIAADRSTK